jgi:hypothetical protein
MKKRIHLSIMQPSGYIHSQSFLDQARYARHQFRRLGAEVTLGKNRLREDSSNIIFGAHLGFPAELKDRYNCIFFNLEELGKGGTSVPKAYLDLLSSSAVIDFDERNLAAYGCKRGDIPVVFFQYASYLATTPALQLHDRPIDLLFLGSANERQKVILERIEAYGWNVSRFNQPIYSEERDHFIRQSKAVLNCHIYDSSRFELAQAFHTLSLATPVISDRTECAAPPKEFKEVITWLHDDGLEAFFQDEFMTADWIKRADNQLRTFATIDSLPSWTIACNYCVALKNMDSAQTPAPWRPLKMHIGASSGEHYKLGWLNVDMVNRAQADILLDWNDPIELPLRTQTASGTLLFLDENQLGNIHTRCDLTRISKVHTVMGNMLRLLKPKGQLQLEISCDHMVRESSHSLSVNSAVLVEITQRFWELGNLDYKFELLDFSCLDANSATCDPKSAASVLITFSKTETTDHEKTVARLSLPDFGLPKEVDAVITNGQTSHLSPHVDLKKLEVSNNSPPMKFVFYTPHYDDNSGGLIAIYKLAHMLNANGHIAKIWHWTRLHQNEVRTINGKVTKEFMIPNNVSQADVDCPYTIAEASADDVLESIVVYPEIIEGNPLGAKKIVRWLLNKPGAINGSNSFGFGDLVFFYADHFLPDGFLAEEPFRLKITDMKLHLYKDTYRGQRQGVYYMIRKGKDVPTTYHPENAIQVDGKNHAELAEIFAKAAMFISYDMHTAYSLFASLCGCDSVVVPRAGMSKEQWKVGKDKSDLDGIAYGYEDIERARQTRPAMAARVQEGQALNVKAMNNFLATCKIYLG